ncbi:unnamed protein product [Lactuca saligna]|uniref:Uncharacterized protein n=1 Tax=Lactuca saligna TaxID=75948 RepID=A0AA35ZAU5_LACSI|nr:unnamed protein product [Lactuca saligna]
MQRWSLGFPALFRLRNCVCSGNSSWGDVWRYCQCIGFSNPRVPKPVQHGTGILVVQGLFLALMSQMIVVNWSERSIREWYSVVRCDYQRMRPAAGLKRGSEHRKKEKVGFDFRWPCFEESGLVKASRRVDLRFGAIAWPGRLLYGLRTSGTRRVTRMYSTSCLKAGRNLTSLKNNSASWLKIALDSASLVLSGGDRDSGRSISILSFQSAVARFFRKLWQGKGVIVPLIVFVFYDMLASTKGLVAQRYQVVHSLFEVEGSTPVVDISEIGSVNVNHSICVLIFSSGCESSTLGFQSFTDIAIFKGKQ